MQLIYDGKPNQSLPRYRFPETFSLSVIDSKFLSDIIGPFIQGQCKSEDLSHEKKTLSK